MSNAIIVFLAILSRVATAALSIPLLLFSAQTFATAPPLSAMSIYCPSGTATDGLTVCIGGEQVETGTPPSGSTTSSFLGYVNTTAVSGAEATWLACSSGVGLDGLPICGVNAGYAVVRGTEPSPTTAVSSFIGYVYTTQVAGTEPTYMTCATTTNIYTGAEECAATTTGSVYSIVRGAAPSGLSWFIGYVYPTIPVTTYTAYPKYYIGSVIYVPPGPGSYIQYGTGTDTGTTLSMTQSWSDDATAGASEGTPKGSTYSYNISITTGDSFGGSTMESTDVELTDNATDKYQAPPSNSLNHDYDQILLFFGVKLTETVNYYGAITWAVSFASLNNTDDAASGYPVSVGCLRANSTIPAAQCSATLAFLTSMGVTSADYAEIMNSDPFANPSGNQVPASSRFVKLNSFSYYGDPTTVTYTYAVINTTTVTNSVTTSYSYSEGFSGSLFGVSLGDKITFTDSSTTTNKTMSTDTSMLSLTMPTTTYTGSTTLNLYEDTVYKTFMFSFY
jgi:hypothetical protein